MRRVAVTVALVAGLGIGIVGPAGAAPKTVGVHDNYFSVPKITVKKGSTVTWKWVDEVETHNVKGKGFSSGYQTSGDFRRKFRKVGKFSVLCDLHPNTMRMKVVVKR